MMIATIYVLIGYNDFIFPFHDSNIMSWEKGFGETIFSIFVCTIITEKILIGYWFRYWD